MAAPYDDAQTFLSEGSNLVRLFYHDRFEAMHSRFGKINSIPTLSKRRIDGDGVIVQVKDGNLYTARTQDDLLGGFPTPRSFSSSTYKVTASETAASNDFRRIDMSLQTTWLDVQRNYQKVSPVDWVNELISESTRNLEESLALHRHLDATARLGTVTGTPKKNDSYVLTSCSAIGATGGARFTLANGSVSAFPRNLVIDVYNGSSLRFSAYVTDYNPADNSVGIYGLSSGVPSSAVDISAIASGDSLYISGERNKGIKGIGYWFSTPAASETFFNRDRTDANYRWLNVHRSGPSASTQLSKSHIDNAALEVAYLQESDNMGYTAIMPPNLEQRYRTEIGIGIMPVQDPQTGNKIADYGFDGVSYRHPTFGRLDIKADALAATGQIRIMKNGDWEMLPYIAGGGFEWLPGDGAGGNWYRVESGTAGAGRTVVLKMDGLMAFADICLFPRRQIQISNVTP